MISVFAMTEKGFTVLSGLINRFGSSFIDKVIGSEDSKIENDYYAEIKELCEKNNITFANRKSAYSISTPYCFAISWQWLIQTGAHSRLIVFHDSILPKYRGFAPLVNALINGESQIGVTALFAAATYDTGDIIYQSSSSIHYPVKIADAIRINNENYIKASLEVAGMISSGEPIPAKAQQEEAATYSLWRDEEDYHINWQQDAERIRRQIDATGYPYKHSFCMADGKKIRIVEAEIVKDLHIENRDAGKFIFVEEGNPVVVCGKGLLKITNAIFDDNKESFLPVKKFRTRLL
ncbi:MAG: methionyl-tRNA formyltransferase [Bacteroidetes bacterium]|nr:methionyl-tRNA formyltransferase [Bacteroidota bacterium]